MNACFLRAVGVDMRLLAPFKGRDRLVEPTGCDPISLNPSTGMDVM